MKISIISGSHRNPSQSEKIGRYIETSLANDFDNIEPYLYSLAELAPLKQQFSESDAFVIIAPEWHGQVPAGLKNFFLMFNRFELGHKPAYIVAVSSSVGGSYPVAELRMSSYKNNRLCYIPEHLIVRDCEKVFNDNEEDNDADTHGYFKSRLNWGLEILIGYGKALKSMRDTTKIHHDDFGNGM